MQVQDLSQLKSIQVKRDRKLCKSCLLGVPPSQAKAAVKQKSNLSERDQDWLRGCYHAKLTQNLHITHDFEIAEGRAKRDF